MVGLDGPGTGVVRGLVSGACLGSSPNQCVSLGISSPPCVSGTK